MRITLLPCLLLFTLVFSHAAAADPALPWELRNHYTFNAKNSALDYAEDNAAWRVRIKETVLIKEVHFDITLGDGTVIHTRDLGEGGSAREQDNAFLGAGHTYSVTFKDLNGLKVVHAARTLNDRPFVMIEISIQNNRAEPVVLKQVRPVIVEDGAITNFGPGALYRSRHLTTQGGMAVFDKAQPPSMAVFHDPDQHASIAVYVFDKGESDAFIRFQPSNGSWAGDAICSYEPGLVIQPGQKITTDPVVVIFGYPSPNKMELFTGWAYAMYMDRKAVKEAPRAMATAPEGGSLNDVLNTARAMKTDGVSAALIPYGWEEKPGTLRGLGGAAGTLSREGFTPGLTLDPLAVEKCKEGCMDGPDGVTWANPAAPEGKNAVTRRIRAAIGNDFAFLALAPSRIPDSVLAQFGLSRAKANNLAFDAAVTAYPHIPIIPAPGAAIPPTLDALLEAASAAGRLKLYGGRFAPLRINLDAGGPSDSNLALALQLWPGPIAFEGSGSGGIQRSLAGGIPPLGFDMAAVDLHHTVSRVWQVMPSNTNQNTAPIGAGITIFPGAQAWHIEDLDLESAEGLRLWNPDNGQFMDAPGVPTPSELRTFGAAPAADRPIMLGVSGGIGLHLERLQNCAWNPATATLTGGFKGGLPSNGKAYVLVPAPWKFKNGEAGGSRVRGDAEGGILSFGLGGSSTNFELTFEK